MDINPNMEKEPNMENNPNMENDPNKEKKPKVRVSMVYDSPKGSVKRKDSGTGAINLITRESGEVLVLCCGHYSELQALSVLLELCQKSFDALESQYIRSLLMTGLEGFTGMAKETVDTMRARLEENETRPWSLSLLA